MSIFARRTWAPSSNSPARIRSNKVQVLFHRPIPIGALLARLGQGAPIFADLVRTQVADIGLAHPDQLESVLVQPVIVVGGVVQAILPVEAQPSHIADDRLHILHALPARVRVVHPKIAGAPVLGGDPEIEADGFGVPDMGISVRFGRKAGGHTSLMLVGSEVFLDDVSDKIGRGRCVGVVHISHFLSAPFRGRLCGGGGLIQSSDTCLLPGTPARPESVVFTTFPLRTPQFFCFSVLSPCDLLDGRRNDRNSSFGNKVPERQYRMPI